MRVLGVAEEVAEREAVMPLLASCACEGVSLVVEAEAAINARDGFGGGEVALDR